MSKILWVLGIIGAIMSLVWLYNYIKNNGLIDIFSFIFVSFSCIFFGGLLYHILKRNASG